MSENEPPVSDPPEEAGELETLKEILVGTERRRIDGLYERLDDGEVRAGEVADILPDAILRGTAQNKRLGESLAPTVEESLQVSIRRNPRALVDAIAPIMGPAIRRSILQAINGMVQNLNQTMEQSFSSKGLRWRVEAWRTGRSFGEVVALHTLKYQVEQVFLIHRETGLLLAHRTVTKATDPDLVGSMLVAIRDFVGDSFSGDSPTGTLDTVQVGDRTIWVETGRDAVIAGVVRGLAPEDYRGQLIQTLEQIEIAYGEPLSRYDGDDSDVAEAAAFLAECMVSEGLEPVAERPSGFRWPHVIWASVAILALVFWGMRFQEGRRWSNLVEALDAEPGIVVVDTERVDGIWVVSGLRDRLAVEPESRLEEHSFSPGSVRFEFEPYLAADPGILVQRIAAELGDAPDVELRVDDGVLVLSGSAPREWLERSSAVAIRNGLSGVDIQAESNESVRLMELSETLREQTLSFAEGSAAITDTSELEAIEDLLSMVDALADTEGVVTIVVEGSADPTTGSVILNTRLAQARAEAVATRLRQRSFEHLRFEPLGSVGGAQGPEARTVRLAMRR